jgi:hypothetical protein
MQDGSLGFNVCPIGVWSWFGQIITFLFFYFSLLEQDYLTFSCHCILKVFYLAFDFTEIKRVYLEIQMRFWIWNLSEAAVELRFWN